MRSRRVELGIVLFALLHAVVMAAPAVVLATAAHKGGLTRFHGIDLVVTSVVLGSAYATFVGRRLWRETRLAERVVDAWIAAFDGLVVLTLAVTLLLIVVMGGFSHTDAAILVNDGWSVVGLWTGVQLAAAGLAELTRRGVLRWLEPQIEPAPPPLTADPAAGSSSLDDAPTRVR